LVFRTGIDLGTTNSCVAIYQNGRVEIIANQDGNYTTPSYVAFTEDERLIGDGAKNAASMNPESTIFDAKRLIGRKFSETQVQSDSKYWPFKVVQMAGDKPGIQVKVKGELRNFTPEEISAMVLSKMKETAEAFLGCAVKDAVITVPAYFNDSQRLATKDAGAIAGLTVHRTINEPTAAALAYGLSGGSLDQATGKLHQEEKNVLVFDLGGGTFDVSLLSLFDGSFEVLATSGNTHLGGEDFDNRVVEYLVKEFEKKCKSQLEKVARSSGSTSSSGGADMRSSARAMRRLRTAAEKAKRTLSSQLSATVEVDALFQGIDFSHNLTRAKFEELNMDLFRSCLPPVEEVLRNAKMDKSRIHEVVLVGGSTRIPKVRTLLQDFFNGKELCMSINPDEAVAYGAAVQGAILAGVKDESLDKVILLDIAPLSLGIETAGGMMAVIVPNGSGIPCAKEEVFSTAADNQPGVEIKVFEGNRTMTAQNHLLGTFTLSGIPPAPRGVPKITVTFNVDANGILDVKAVDSGSKVTKSIRISNDSNRLTQEQIARMQADAIQFKEEDDKIREAVEARNKFSDLVYRVEASLKDEAISNRLSSTDKDHLEKASKEARDWIDDSPSKDTNEIKSRMAAFESISGPIMAKIYQEGAPMSANSPSNASAAAPIIEEVE
jgi:L1 cell adhesion molecule like protein